MSFLFKTLSVCRSFCGSVFAVLLFPQSCISCGCETAYVPLCKKCRDELKNGIEKKEKRCKRCGRILISEKEICIECRDSDTIAHLDGVFPLYPYVLWKKELLFMWKTEGVRSLSPFFASLIYKVWKAYYPNIPFVPVPPRPGKIFREGWDQIDELCRFLHGFYGVHIYKVLKRLFAQQQKKLNRNERLCADSKRYILKPKNALPVSFLRSIPEAVVLLDDIMTTGATLENCAAVLKEAGIKYVYAITLFSC